MFERFTDAARRAVVGAQEEARFLDHDSIGPEHLLVALVRDEDGLASAILRARGVTADAARHAIASSTATLTWTGTTGHIPFTPDTKQVLELSLREALDLRHEHIAPEHLALALTRERTSATRVFDALGVDIEALREELVAHAADFDRRPSGAARRGTELRSAAVIRTPPRVGRIGPRRFGGDGVLRCSLCGRSEPRIDRMVVARGVAVCDRCIGDLAGMLAATEEGQGKVLRFVPREVALANIDSATRQIEHAFSVVFGALRGGVEAQVAVIEDGPELRSFLQAWAQHSSPHRHLATDVTVERIRFVDEHEADVSLGIWLQGNTANPML